MNTPVVLFAEGYDGSWPAWYIDDYDEECEVAWPSLIAPHLAPNEVCIMMEVGSERQRYLIGYARAIHSDGRVLELSLDDIYDKVHETFGIPRDLVRPCTY